MADTWSADELERRLVTSLERLNLESWLQAGAPSAVTEALRSVIRLPREMRGVLAA